MAPEINEETRELCTDFVTESREMLSEIEPVLMELESSCAASGVLDKSKIDSVFRAFHSMKGSGGFLDLNHLVAVTHQAESLLDLFRMDKAELQARHITALCRGMDWTLRVLEHIEAHFHDEGFEAEADELVALLKAEMDAALADGEPAEAPGAELPDTPVAEPEASAETASLDDW